MPQNFDIEMKYMERWFLPLRDIAEGAGLDKATAQKLIDHRGAPGPIYAYSEDHGWWSALAAYIGKDETNPPDGSRQWHSPGAIWWLRRAKLFMSNGADATAAAKNNTEHFAASFVREVEQTPDAKLAYPTCFPGGVFNLKAAQDVAASEWAAWTSGAYGVCLRFFSAESCVRKEALAARIKKEMAGRHAENATSDEHIFDMCEQLASLVLPFAPWERSSGTPGIAIDRPLEALSLGRERPYE